MIIYEGKDIFLHYYDGDTDYVVITFDTEPFEAHERFYGQKVFEKRNISALGFTSRLSSWYHSTEMEEAAKLCNDISKKYKKRILIGPSKGSYGAQKHSKRLNADSVFLMGPRSYIHAGQGQPVPELFREYAEFAQTLNNAPILPEELAGTFFVAYDPLDHQEVINFDLVRKNYPSAYAIPTFYTGHYVAYSLAGTDNFQDTIEALETQDVNVVRKVISRIRRRHGNTFAKILEKYEAYGKHPLLVYRLITSEAFKKVKNYEQVFDSSDKIVMLCYHLIRKGYKSEASSLFNFYLQKYLLKKRFEIEDNKFIVSDVVDLPYLISFHGYNLCYSAQGKKLVNCRFWHENIIDIPLRLYQQNGHYKLIGLWNQIWVELISKDDQIKIRPLTNQSDTNIEIIFHDDMIAIKNPKGFVTADPDSETRINTSHVQEWELFAPLSLNYPVDLTEKLPGAEQIDK